MSIDSYVYFKNWEQFKASCGEELTNLELDNYELYAWLTAIRSTIDKHKASLNGQQYNSGDCPLCKAGILLARRDGYDIDEECFKCPWRLVFRLDEDDTENSERSCINNCYDDLRIADEELCYKDKHETAIKRLQIWEELILMEEKMEEKMSAEAWEEENDS